MGEKQKCGILGTKRGVVQEIVETSTELKTTDEGKVPLGFSIPRSSHLLNIQFI